MQITGIKQKLYRILPIVLKPSVGNRGFGRYKTVSQPADQHQLFFLKYHLKIKNNEILPQEIPIITKAIVSRENETFFFTLSGLWSIRTFIFTYSICSGLLIFNRHCLKFVFES